MPTPPNVAIDGRGISCHSGYQLTGYLLPDFLEKIYVQHDTCPHALNYPVQPKLIRSTIIFSANRALGASGDTWSCPRIRR